MARNNRAASMEKERWGGEGYLDNRAGDRSTMAAVFSIRHYLIDRVAGLIVRGGYFRAAFVWGSAVLPHPSSTLNSLNPPPFATLAPAEALLSCVRLCVLVHVMCESVDREWAFYVPCYLLSISRGQSVAGPELQARWRERGINGRPKVVGVGRQERLTPSSWPVVLGITLAVRRHWPTLSRPSGDFP